MIVALWWMVGGTAIHAQPRTYDDIGEVNGYGGGGFGGLGAHGWVGGATGAQFSKYGLVFIDTSFLPLGDTTLLPETFISAKSRLYDFNFSVHIQVPIGHRWAPYGLLAPALLFNTYDVQRVRPNGVVYFHGQSDAKFGFEVGGGARCFLGENWGVKGEYRYTISTRNFSRVLGGFFYQFQGPWPFLPRGSKKRGRTVGRD